MGCSEDDEREEGNNRALLTVMTARLESQGVDAMSGMSYGQKNYGMFALDDDTQEILHYSEENSKENTMLLRTA